MISNSNNNTSTINSVAMPHTPPAPLQPIINQTFTDMYHYFGGVTASGGCIGLSGSVNQAVGPPQPPAPQLSSIRLVCNSETTNSDTAATSMDHDGQMVNQQPVFSFNREATAMSLQEKRHTLSRKLAQRSSKHELVERGILPRTNTFRKIFSTIT